jgi:LytR cell envelope-related transcriptional attenuator
MVLILAFSLQDQVEKYGAYVGLAAFLGLAVLSLLYFAQARELKRLRDWAGRAPERAQELEARVVAQAEEALREPEPVAERSGSVGPAVPVAKPAAAPASGNGRQAGTPAPIPMGPRPATAVAALAARAQATVEAPALPATGDGDQAAVEAGDQVVVPGTGDEGGAPPEEDRAAVPGGEPAGDEEEAPAAEQPAPAPAPDEDRAEEPARSGNGVPAEPPTQIPRATPRPQPQPAPAAAPLRATPPSRAATLPPPRRSAARRRPRGDNGSRAGIYTLIGIVVLVIAIFVPVYFTVLTGDEETPPPDNQVANPGASPTADGGAGERAAEARPEKVVVVLNGTPTDGLASGERDKLIAAGYSEEQGMLRIDNNPDQQCQDSVVFYGAEERRQARDVSNLLDITRTEQIDEETQALADSSDETGTLPADVVALLCADKSP